MVSAVAESVAFASNCKAASKSWSADAIVKSAHRGALFKVGLFL